MFRQRAEKRAIKQYAGQLPGALKARYGGSGYDGYTDAQVATTVRALGLSQRYIAYALLLFCGEEFLLSQGFGGERILEMVKLLGSVGGGGAVGMAEAGVASSGFLGGVFDAGSEGSGGGGGE